MRVLYSLEKPGPFPSPNALTIGTFDGVHKGHQYLLKLIRKHVGQEGTVTLLSFSNHPSEILPHREPVPLLTSPTIKTRLLEQYGVNLLYLLPFTLELASLSYKEFLTKLYTVCPFDSLFLGQDGRIGRKREGTPEKVSELGEELGFTAHYIEKLDSQNAPISSAAIRTLIQSGSLSEAQNLLGHPYAIEGILQKDQSLFLKDNLCLPPPGKYPVTLHENGQRQKAVARVANDTIFLETTLLPNTKPLVEFT